MTKRKPYCSPQGCKNPIQEVEKCPSCGWEPAKVSIASGGPFPIAGIRNCPACGKCVWCNRMPKQLFEIWWPEKVN